METCLTSKVVLTVSYLFIIWGSFGMIVFATKFTFSTGFKLMKYTKEKYLGLNGYQVWRDSWILIIVGTALQVLNIWGLICVTK